MPEKSVFHFLNGMTFGWKIFIQKIMSKKGSKCIHGENLALIVKFRHKNIFFFSKINPQLIISLWLDNCFIHSLFLTIFQSRINTESRIQIRWQFCEVTWHVVTLLVISVIQNKFFNFFFHFCIQAYCIRIIHAM